MPNEPNIPHKDLVAEIDAFCGKAGMSRSRFGAAAVRDPRFVFDLEAGRECRSKTLNAVRSFMRAHPAPTPTGDAA
ncbi:hypothetical protein JMJ94_12405 [Rhodovulum visakhapatnamense]|uniref:Uncharacterized protein n=1 Tax=Rhodovulum visakhapatnamense TaxID=364297 RepID=A0ABS1RJS5_9RHOB|nr:hypothetical protein [Rhodovulum visakhapatnamense]MBL3570292.1 hypothetical protein [Rhodovulum visakhapatnamense]MBL3578956.1 hypothetical protein [Rhodovulum visakhapatnamense]